jgi:hypothetical protein
MRTTSKLGLKVWNDPNDQFNPSDLAFNWDAIDAFANTPQTIASSVDKGTTLPTGLVAGDAGRIFFLTAPASGYAANSVMEWTGSAWNVVGPRETQSALPVSGNYPGRSIVLSAAASGFAAWSVMVYDGTIWQKVGGVESSATVPASGNFAGRTVILTAADSGFEAFSLITYNGSAWSRTEKRGVEVGAALPGAPYAGQVFVVSAATGGFSAWDVVRYNGSSWAKIGPNVIRRTLTGIIPAAGTTQTAGTGFTYTHTNGTGIYVFTFTTAFPAAPAVTVTPTTTQTSKVWAYVTATSTTGCTIATADNTTGALDASFIFVANETV